MVTVLLEKLEKEIYNEKGLLEIVDFLFESLDNKKGLTREVIMDKIKIELASLQDIQQLLDIYSYYVKNTAITFEYDVPSQQEFQNRMENVLKKYPYLVAKKDKEILGYVYASAFHQRAAYNWNVETSIYVKHDCCHSGVGKKLYFALEKILKAQNITNLNACIASPIEESQYLTDNSIKFHQHLGYKYVGKFHQCGYKFHQWFDIVWMEKIIGEHTLHQADILSFYDVKDQFFNERNEMCFK